MLLFCCFVSQKKNLSLKQEPWSSGAFLNRGSAEPLGSPGILLGFRKRYERLLNNAIAKVKTPQSYLYGIFMFDNKIVNRKRPIFKSALNIPLSRIAFIRYQNYVKDAQTFYWLNPLRKSLAQL
jgi:hypothetical protein